MLPLPSDITNAYHQLMEQTGMLHPAAQVPGVNFNRVPISPFSLPPATNALSWHQTPANITTPMSQSLDEVNGKFLFFPMLLKMREKNLKKYGTP